MLERREFLDFEEFDQVFGQLLADPDDHFKMFAFKMNMSPRDLKDDEDAQKSGSLRRLAC